VSYAGFWQLMGPLVGGVFGFFAAIFAEPIRQWIWGPKLKLSFDEEGCVTTTQTNEGKWAHTLRIRVVNKGRSIAKDCRAYLVGVQVNSPQSIPYCDSLPLAWSCKGNCKRQFEPLSLPKKVPQCIDLLLAWGNRERQFEPLSLPKKVPQYIDLLSFFEREVLWYGQECHTIVNVEVFLNRYKDLFTSQIRDRKAQTKFTVLVSCDNGKPGKITVEFKAGKAWNDFQARRAGSNDWVRPNTQYEQEEGNSGPAL